MRKHHLRTLEALFAHPLQHGVRVSQVEALFRSLGAEVSERDDRRLHIRLPNGAETWIRASGVRQPDLDAEAVMRVRRFLEEAGVSPDHPEADAPSPRGDQSHRLVLHLNHHQSDVYRLEGTEVEHAVLRPHAVLLLGHGTGASDMRQVLLHHLETHRRDLLDRIVGIETLDDGGMGDAQLLAIAREHFGNLPHRRPLVEPGQELVRG